MTVREAARKASRCADLAETLDGYGKDAEQSVKEDLAMAADFLAEFGDALMGMEVKG